MRRMDEDNTKIFDIIEQAESIPKRLKPQRDGFTRQDVVNSFQNAFQMMGGVQRLALWANAHPDKFYPLYTKLLPATSFQFGSQDLQQIHHAIPPTALDMHPGPAPIFVEDAEASSQPANPPEGILNEK